MADRVNANRDIALPGCPRWCYLPVHAARAITEDGGQNPASIDRMHHVAIIGALAAWRMGQQIIRYDGSLYNSLVETPITGDLPAELLYRLPAWCLYIETPGLSWMGRQLHGFFVHLDWDKRGHNELRFLLDTVETTDALFDFRYGLIPNPLILGNGTLADALERVVAFGKLNAEKAGIELELSSTVDQMAESLSTALSPLISLTLYLCSDSPDWDLEPPRNPTPVKTKRGLRTFPVAQPRIWDVGVRIGAALRKAVASPRMEEVAEAEHASPRAHIRRAHWHTYLTGTGRSKRVLKWLHPMLVKTDTVEDFRQRYAV